MSLWTETSRLGRRAAWRLGLLADPNRAAARHIERVLDIDARALFDAGDAPGLAVVVRLRNGRTIERCFGRAGDAKPMTADAVLPVMSITKPITAACVMALVDRGMLDLDEPVWRKLTSYRMPARAATGVDPDGVTLRGLLSHSSGVRLAGHGWAEEGNTRGALELLREEPDEAHTLRIVEPPGRSLTYAGGGFLLVEVMIEDVTGRPFPEVARDLVLAPFGMTSSDYALTPPMRARLATTYDAERRPLPERIVLATAASGLYSTARDLVAFWSAFAPGPDGEPPGRGVISPAACREMLTTQIVGEDGTACGLGFYLGRRRRESRYLHLGYFDGIDHQVEGLIGRRAVVAMLSNGDPRRGTVRSIARLLRKTLLERTV